jgi:ABC-type antimicrobial peptide transport system permease subunit
VRELLTRLVPDRPLSTVPVSHTVQRQLGGVRTNAMQIAGFALVGLLLAVIGVYGVLAFETARRTREIGIRGALGASRSRIARMVLVDATKVMGLGLLIGLPAALSGMRLIRGLLYSTDPRDPMVYGAVALCIVLVSLVAAYIPARRASRVDPLEALRAE